LPSEKFSKSDRLLTKLDFNSLRVDSTKLGFPTFLVFYKTNTLPHARLGISVSKKVGKAHDRNFIKRTTREFFRRSNYRFQSVDLIIVFKHGLCKRDNWRNSCQFNLNKLFESNHL
jgi:ribonuclease P protein component